MSGRAPRTDADVPAYWRALGLPGLVDVHTHFMPARLLEAVWAYFDTGGPLLGRRWPVAYRLPEQERVARLRALGVRAFTAMLYPHKPAMAEGLNAWAADFARRTPDCLPTATFFPEPGVAAYLGRALDDGARVCKVHVQVGGFDPRDPLLDDAWGLLAERQTPVVIHCGSGPVPAPGTGPAPVAEVLRRHPGLVLVIAHLGGPEYAEFLTIAEGHPQVRLDTTMAFTAFFERLAPFPRALLPRLAALRDRVLLGSDFPNIPHPYADQLAALDGLGLGPEWLRAVLWHNGARLFGVPPCPDPLSP